MRKGVLAKMTLIAVLSFFMFSGHGRLEAMQFQGGMDLGMALPLGQFKKNIDKDLVFPRISLSFAVKLGNLPVFFGINGSFMIYGKDSREESVYIPEFGKIYFDVTHTYEIYAGDLFLRFQTQSSGPLNPYVDVLIGLNHFYSDSSILASYRSDESTPDFVRKTNHKDTVFCYGFGCGVMWRLATSGYENRKRPIGHMLDVGVRYTAGQQAEYLKKGSVVIVNGEAEYHSFISTVPMLAVRIGYTATF